jgi:hypothetical protein
MEASNSPLPAETAEKVFTNLKRLLKVIYAAQIKNGLLSKNSVSDNAFRYLDILETKESFDKFLASLGDVKRASAVKNRTNYFTDKFWPLDPKLRADVLEYLREKQLKSVKNS